MKLLFLFLMLVSLLPCRSQESDTLRLTVASAIDMARKQSPDVLVARHSFRSSYWNYCYYKANYKPGLTFYSTPYYNNQINIVTMEDGTSKYIRQKQLRTDGNLSLTQNIPWTGGSISLNTNLQRLDILGDENYHTYRANPLTLSFYQSVGVGAKGVSA